MTDTLRDRLAQAVETISHDFVRDQDDDVADLVLVDGVELLDTIERVISAEHRQDDGTPVEFLGLPPRLTGDIRRSGIHTIEQLTALTAKVLRATRGVGPLNLDIIQNALAARGLALTDATPPPAFFQVGKTYIDSRAQRSIFRCGGTAAHPTTGALFGFGFARQADSTEWGLYLVAQEEYAKGWTEHAEDSR